ncbi:Hypothetical protein BN2458_PEG0505 [Helicobacter typhlonius]|uniref:Uncharacterized protein n=1 Tax=Helicobacter typhlonius TaxID=76936 RepID=A0A0S4PSW6_9HELI|nr:Hypothetical protein BN2458_PEG0505 [Helicobacter typhlonius]
MKCALAYGLHHERIRICKNRVRYDLLRGFYIVFHIFALQ